MENMWAINDHFIFMVLSAFITAPVLSFMLILIRPRGIPEVYWSGGALSTQMHCSWMTGIRTLPSLAV
jgi:hypothetical protein